MSVPTDPAGGASPERSVSDHLDAVRAARSVVTSQTEPPSVQAMGILLRDLLAAYDFMAGRLAMLAASAAAGES